MKKICVIGSINTDIVTTVDSFPVPGQTVKAKGFGIYAGGKGGNQCVAAGRLGGNVSMIGKVGDDTYGDNYIGNLKMNNIDIKGVAIEMDTPSGLAIINVSATGENIITVVAGANDKVDIQHMEKSMDIIKESDIVLFQLEIPVETLAYAIKAAGESGKTVILDPAPAQKLPEDIFKYVDIITPNETETEFLAGRKIGNEDELLKCGLTLINLGVKNVISKAGKKGAYLINNDTFKLIPGYKVNAVDTTAAGDTFNGALAVALSRGKSLEESIDFANLAAAISTTGLGAQSAMPRLADIEKSSYTHV